MKQAAMELHKLKCKYVLIKGGHLDPAEECTDILYDGQQFFEFVSPRYHTRHTHGTGCTLSTAIACELAKGKDVQFAVKKAKEYITGAIGDSLGRKPIGHGNGPLDHFYQYNVLKLTSM